MKKIISFVFCISLTGLIGTVSVSCSSDNDDTTNGKGSPEQTEEGAIFPAVINADNYISQFFAAERPSSDTSKSKSFFLDSKGSASTENIVCIINSQDDLKAQYSGNMSLPNIDFANYTLIIGQQRMGSLGWDVTKQLLLVNGDKATLNLHVTNRNEYQPDMFMTLYYWGLYPKQKDNILLTVNVVKD